MAAVNKEKMMGSISRHLFVDVDKCIPLRVQHNYSGHVLNLGQPNIISITAATEMELFVFQYANHYSFKNESNAELFIGKLNSVWLITGQNKALVKDLDSDLLPFLGYR